MKPVNVHAKVNATWSPSSEKGRPTGTAHGLVRECIGKGGGQGGELAQIRGHHGGALETVVIG